MQTLIFSKDRTAQLELLLRSIKDKWIGFADIKVIYRATTPDFDAGYNKVRQIHPEFSYVKESNFRNDLLSNLNDDEYKMFLVDDIVFIRNFSLNETEVKTFFNRPDILTLSLRLSPHINYCYTQKKSCSLPPFNQDRTWNWKRQTPFPSDWEYPLSLDGHIFRFSDIKHMFFNGNYRAPNTLEGYLDSQSGTMSKTLMLCFNESKIMNIPVNRVQNENLNHAGLNHYFGNDILNQIFLGGKVISTENIYGLNPNSPHYEIPFKFI
jgi:hypothetical protein